MLQFNAIRHRMIGWTVLLSADVLAAATPEHLPFLGSLHRGFSFVNRVYIQGKYNVTVARPHSLPFTSLSSFSS